MYIGHGRLFVCLSLSAFPHYCSDPDVTEREMSARACTCSMPGLLLSVKTLMVVIALAALLH